jgi:hypothetical protein
MPDETDHGLLHPDHGHDLAHVQSETLNTIVLQHLALTAVVHDLAHVVLVVLQPLVLLHVLDLTPVNILFLVVLAHRDIISDHHHQQQLRPVELQWLLAELVQDQHAIAGHQQHLGKPFVENLVLAFSNEVVLFVMPMHLFGNRYCSCCYCCCYWDNLGTNSSRLHLLILFYQHKYTQNTHSVHMLFYQLIRYQIRLAIDQIGQFDDPNSDLTEI